MLGYVQIYKPDLKVREYEIYQGYYCGICKYIGSRFGQLPRMSLSYDAAFLALLLSCTDDAPDRPVQEHCIVHHIKKKTVIRNDAVKYAGDVMLILAWHKLLDDIEDEGSKTSAALTLLLRRIYKKLNAEYPSLCRKIIRNLKELRRLEKSKCTSLDQVAEPFALIMADIFEEGSVLLHENDTLLHQNFAMIGYHMGKWIYLMDAVDDIKENIEGGTYNPLLYRFDYNGEEPGAFKQRISERLEFNLYQYLAVIADCARAIDIKKNKGIIDNIIYFGLNQKTEKILAIEDSQKEKDSK